MRVLILTPTVLPRISGNAVTTERWRRGLADAGNEVQVVATEGLGHVSAAGHLREFQPDVVHAHHLFKAGAVALGALSPRTPLVVSPAGTDWSEDLLSPQRGPAVESVLRRARIVVVPVPETRDQLIRRFPDLLGRVEIVPKALTWLGNDPFDLRAESGCTPQHFLFFLPAGVRPVKRNLECLEALADVHRQRPHVRAVFAGPAVHTAYARAFSQEVARYPFARWLEAIPPTAMGSALRSADVVLNTSLAEGMSNAVLEAVAAGVPALASGIPSNRWALDGSGGAPPAGILFDVDDWQEFVREALRLVDEPELRVALSRAAQHRGAAWPSSQEEARGLATAYRRALDEATVE